MGSKFIVPLELFDFNTTPADISSSGYKSLYLKSGWLKKLTGTTETDLVLKRPIDTFTTLGVGNTGALTNTDTIEQAFNKIQQSLYIKLVGDVTGTAAYNAGNLEIVTTVVNGGSSVPLAATKFDVQHYTTPLGNPYLIGDIVYYNGHIFRAIANNDAIPPAIGGNAYWTDLGAGYPYRQNVANWTATSGDTQIINKPTTLSAFTNDVGFLTTESDPVFSASAAGGISATDVTNWNTAYTNMDKAHTVYATVHATEDIPAGHVVNVVSGYTLNPSTGMPSVANADKTSEATSDKVLGIAPFAINTGNVGEVITKGPIYGLDTHTASVGDIAWLNTFGDIVYTATMAGRPLPPKHAIYIGVVTISDPTNGSIYVDIQNGFELSELHDVSASIPADKDVLSYNASSGLWESTNISTLVTGGGLLYGIATGTDTYSVTISGVSSYADGSAYIIKFTNGNTTSATLNLNTFGAVPLYRNNDGQLIGGDIVAGSQMLCVYDSAISGFRVIGTAPNTLLGYVTNDDSVTITKGQVVYAFSGTGDRMTVKLASNTSESTSAQTVGIVLSASIAPNQKGMIIMQGLLDGLSILPTSTFADGDPLYLGSTAGSITKTKPSAPNHLVYLGNVTTASNGSAGRWYVRIQNGYELQELHNVSISSVANNEVLTYETATSLWKNKSIVTALGYTPVTNARNLTINGTTYDLSADRSWTITAGVSSVTASSPLSSSGGATPNITIALATSSVSGYLSSTDWTTFNNKQNALGFTPPPNTRTITINGVTQDLSADRTFTISTGNTAGLALANYYNFI